MVVSMGIEPPLMVGKCAIILVAMGQLAPASVNATLNFVFQCPLSTFIDSPREHAAICRL